jgi:hypothetical protein
MNNPNLQLIDLLKEAGVTELAVASTDTAYSRSFPLAKEAVYSFEYKLSSAGTMDVKVELEQGNTPPATEGAASDDFTVPQGTTALEANLAVNTLRIKAYTPAATGYARLKFTGQGSNASTTKLARIRVGVLSAL